MPSGLGPPISRVGSTCRRTGQFGVGLHGELRAEPRHPPDHPQTVDQTRFVSASAVTLWVTSPSTCWTNSHASSVFGTRGSPSTLMVRHSLT